jgi:hypothetical protein
MKDCPVGAVGVNFSPRVRGHPRPTNNIRTDAAEKGVPKSVALNFVAAASAGVPICWFFDPALVGAPPGQTTKNDGLPPILWGRGPGIVSDYGAFYALIPWYDDGEWPIPNHVSLRSEVRY